MLGCAFGVLGWAAVADAQCADGTVDTPIVSGVVAGCAGAWNAPGLVDADGNPVGPSCGRLAGNDGDYTTSADMEAVGASCSPADLCAAGWGLCSEDDATIGGASCGDVSETSPGVTYVAATDSCSFAMSAQVVGCGTLGCESDFSDTLCSLFDRQSDGENTEDPCATLDRSGCNDGTSVDAGWSCTPEGGSDDEPVTAVTKAKSAGGGVLCCFREVCDCVDAAGGCFVDGEMPDRCTVCEADERPGVPLTTIADCGADAGASAPDGGPIPSDLGVEEPLDLGAPPNRFDAGVDGNPEISFRGDGGCECRTAGEGAPTLGLLAMVLFAFRRRRCRDSR